MSLYHVQEVTFDLPPSLKDKTVNLFVLNESGASDFSFVISRDLVKPGLTLLRYSERLIMEMESRMPELNMQSRTEVIINETPAVLLDYTWVSDGVRLAQRQLILLVKPPGAKSPQALLLTFTAREWSPQSDAAYQQVVSSLRFRE